VDYRHEARKYLKRGEHELTSGDDERLKYAALELRMAMEALTYDRAIAYMEEFPPSEYETWQPRKVMSVLLDIDPTADKDGTYAIGLEKEYGVQPAEMDSLGTEKILNMQTLRKHYDALGSYLHVPTIKQASSEKSPDFSRMRSRCEEIAGSVREVLSSPIFNVTLGNFATLDCMECGKPIRKRIPHGKTEVRAQCYECGASYMIVDIGNRQVKWKPQQHEVECGNNSCQHKIIVWHHELEIGRYWTCSACSGRNTFLLGIRH
jgi:DNA-directed RNA polymerase subunit RPC12/RpoP